MLKRMLICLPLIVALVLLFEPIQAVHSSLLTAEEIASMETSDAKARSSETQQKENGFVRAMKAPFKALGRLFGGKKKEESRVAKISADDVRKFESVPVQQVKNTPAPVAGTTQPAIDGPSDALALLESGRKFLESGELDRAIGDLSKAASLDPKLGEASSLLGVAYERKGFRDRALKAFDVAMHAEGDEPQHLNNLGFLHYKNGDYEQAVKYLKRAAKLDPDDARIWNNLGLAQFQRRNFDDAYRSFARAMGEYKGRLNLAVRLEAEGYSKEAIKQLEKARSVEPKSTEVLARLVRLYSQTGRLDDAESTKTQLLAINALANAPAPQ
jgi:Flp pilus assembly protein TadD